MTISTKSTQRSKVKLLRNIVAGVAVLALVAADTAILLEQNAKADSIIEEGSSSDSFSEEYTSWIHEQGKLLMEGTWYDEPAITEYMKMSTANVKNTVVVAKRLLGTEADKRLNREGIYLQPFRERAREALIKKAEQDFNTRACPDYIRGWFSLQLRNACSAIEANIPYKETIFYDLLADRVTGIFTPSEQAVNDELNKLLRKRCLTDPVYLEP